MQEIDRFGAFVDYPDVPVPHAPGGPLAGLSFAVKDIFDVARYPTGCGNPVRRAECAPATVHAPVVASLLAAGARFAGKTHTAEFAYSLDGRNDHFGTPRNPRAPGRVPGGSSSGSAAAVAAGLVDFALGSDTGGSIRGPASFCGILGLRPTFGRVDIAGTMPLAPEFDTVGWFADDAAVLEAVGAVLLGADDAGPALARFRIADDAFALLAAAERDALLPALDRVAAALEMAGGVTVAPDGLAAWRGPYQALQGFQVWQAHGAWLGAREPGLLPQTRRRFEIASAVSAAEAEAGRVAQAAIRHRMEDILGIDSVLALPSMPAAAPAMDATDEEIDAYRMTASLILSLAVMAGLPQISLPLATIDGFPLGLSLIAPSGRDRALLALARRIMQT